MFINKKNTTNAHQFFEKTKKILDWSDFNVVNLEGVITESKVRFYDKERFPYALSLDKKILDVFKNYKINYFTRANNHSMDFGPEEMLKTSQILNQEHFYYAGVGRNDKEAFQPIVIEKDGIKIAIYSFTTTYPKEAWAQKEEPGVAAPTVAKLIEILKQAT
ncbi:MAG: CapA family protein, partial [Silvanigrellaceae bacterium]|nr:CapA family protein [Silvanigrellaceae bacterium]